MLFPSLTRPSVLVIAATLSLAAYNDSQAAKKAPDATEQEQTAAPAQAPAAWSASIDFGKPELSSSIREISGLSHQEDWGRWSDGETVSLQFAQPLPKEFILFLAAKSFGPNAGQTVTVKAGDREQTFKLDSNEERIYRLDFKLAKPTDRLEFLIPKPTSPAELKLGDDARKLGIGFMKLRIAPPVTSVAGIIDFKESVGFPAFVKTVSGLSDQEHWGRWSNGETVSVEFAKNLPKKFILFITARAFGPNVGEELTVKAGEHEQKFKMEAGDRRTYRLDFKLAKPTDRLEFLIPKPTSPAELKISEDARTLGIGLITIQITPETETKTKTKK